MSSGLVLALAVACAIVAAVRSTWSPCGLSMLSTLTPLAEAGRGRRYGVTAAWFVVGACAGGAATGVLAALMALAVSGLGPTAQAVLGLSALAAAIASGFDLGVVPPRLPHHRRQVNESWLRRYRSWVYGSGFGVQIGCGVSTYIMTAGVYATVVLAALTGSAAMAFGVCVLFGLGRGLMVLLGARIRTTDDLVAFHARFERAGEPVRFVTIAMLLGVMLVAASAAWGGWGLAASAGVACGLSGLAMGVRQLRT